MPRRSVNRLTSFVSLVLVVACASGPKPGDSGSARIDLTGADVAQWDSLAHTYFKGPDLRQVIIPPLPVPANVHGTTVMVVLRIDERGRVTRVSMSPLSDGAYARRFARMLLETSFGPASNKEGKPMVGYYRLKFEL